MSFAPPAAAEELAELEHLVRSGAPQLAARRAQDIQIPFAKDPRAWERLERLRIALLEREEAWGRIAERLKNLPAPLSDGFARFAELARARAELRLGDPAAARARLRRALWQESGWPPEQLREARWLIADAYVDEGRAEEAEIALVRFAQDFGRDDAFAWWRSRWLLRLGRHGAAREALLDLKDPESRALALLAGLRAGLPPAKVLAEARTLRENATDQAALLDGIAAEAARLAEQPAEAIAALERGLAALGRARAPREVALGGAPLWEAYRGYAVMIANEALLLLGDDPAWERRAVAQEPGSREHRALLGWLARNAADPARRGRAHAELVRVWAARPEGGPVLARLYFGDSGIAPLDVPPVERGVLARIAIEDGAWADAADWLTGAQPPKDMSEWDWALTHARVMVLAGRIPDAVERLQRLVAAMPEKDPQAPERLNHVLLELQSLGKHREALGVWSQLVTRPEARARARELLYWMADSFAALAEDTEAARLYLASASVEDPLALDEWAQSARFQAARALVRAGLPGDARRQLEMLINATRDPARRATLAEALRDLPAERRR